MDLQFTPEEIAFRQEVRDLPRERLPGRAARQVLARRVLQGRLPALAERRSTSAAGARRPGRRNTAAPAGPRPSATSSRKNAPAPKRCRSRPSAWRCWRPVLMAFASEEQKAHYLPRIIDGTDFWCQGYSEPGAGSDLASLKTKAERVGDHYIINGQKTWTTLGHSPTGSSSSAAPTRPRRNRRKASPSSSST